MRLLHSQRCCDRSNYAISGAASGILLHMGIDACRLLIGVPEDKAPVMASVSPDDTAADPIVCRNVCGVTPGRLASFTTLTK